MEFFRADANREGLTLDQYGAKYGIQFARSVGQQAANEVILGEAHIEQGHCSACTTGPGGAD